MEWEGGQSLSGFSRLLQQNLYLQTTSPAAHILRLRELGMCVLLLPPATSYTRAAGTHCGFAPLRAAWSAPPCLLPFESIKVCFDVRLCCQIIKLVHHARVAHSFLPSELAIGPAVLQPQARLRAVIAHQRPAGAAMVAAAKEAPRHAAAWALFAVVVGLPAEKISALADTLPVELAGTSTFRSEFIESGYVFSDEQYNF